jgi:hypothetical protein
MAGTCDRRGLQGEAVEPSFALRTFLDDLIDGRDRTHVATASLRLTRTVQCLIDAPPYLPWLSQIATTSMRFPYGNRKIGALFAMYYCEPSLRRPGVSRVREVFAAEAAIAVVACRSPR